MRVLHIVLLTAMTVSAAHSPQGAERADPRVNIASLCSEHAMRSPVQKGSNLLARIGATTFTFEENSRKLLVDRMLIWMNSPALAGKNGWTLSRADSENVLAPLISMVPDPTNKPRRFLVVIDPGHGGDDTGALGQSGLREKTVTLDLAKRVRKMLKSSGFSVRMTRTKDSALTTQERAAKAKKWGAGVFVSVHVNSAGNRDASGLETYVLASPGFQSTAGRSVTTDARPGNRFDGVSILLGYHVHRQMLALAGGEDRGIRHARFDVLSEAPCPAVLVECGFISNKTDEQRLRDEDYLDRVAEGIAQGILAYAKSR